MAEQTAVTTAPEKKSERLGSAKGAGVAAEGAGVGAGAGEHERRGWEERCRSLDTTLPPMRCHRRSSAATGIPENVITSSRISSRSGSRISTTHDVAKRCEASPSTRIDESRLLTCGEVEAPW